MTIDRNIILRWRDSPDDIPNELTYGEIDEICRVYLAWLDAPTGIMFTSPEDEGDWVVEPDYVGSGNGPRVKVVSLPPHKEGE